MYPCEYCGTVWRFPFSAALCCDVISNELDDENPDIILSVD